MLCNMKMANCLLLILGTLLSFPWAITCFPFSDNTSTTLSKPTTGSSSSTDRDNNLLPRGRIPQTNVNFIPDYITAPAGNPFLPGIRAKPVVVVYDNTYWIFFSQSKRFDCDTSGIYALSSFDLVNWNRWGRVFNPLEFPIMQSDESGESFYACQVSNPVPLKGRDGRYYLYYTYTLTGFKAAGINVGVADHPAGPYKPLASANPVHGVPVHLSVPSGNVNLVDPSIFVDDDAHMYLYWGGWETADEQHWGCIEDPTRDPDAKLGRCIYGAGKEHAHEPPMMMAEVSYDMISVTVNPEAPSAFFTPNRFSGGARVFKRKGVYYMLYDSARWNWHAATDPTLYRINYATAPKPTGPWKHIGTALGGTDDTYEPMDHSSVVNVPGTDIWYIFYNIKKLGGYAQWYPYPEGSSEVVHLNGHREPDFDKRIAFERLEFDDSGYIKQPRMPAHDNFDNDNLDNWRVYGKDADFRLADKKLVGRQQGLVTITGTNWWNVVAEADVELTSTTTTNGSAGLVVRARPYPATIHERHHLDGPYDFTGTYAAISTRDGGLVVLEGMGEDKRYLPTLSRHYPIKNASMPIERGRTYHVRITAEEEVLKVFVDDMQTPRIESRCSDPENRVLRPDSRVHRPWCELVNWTPQGAEAAWKPPLPGQFGNVGVRVHEASAKFDDFKASSLGNNAAFGISDMARGV